MRIDPAARLAGEVLVPGDKSISHRAVLLAALCEGETIIHGFGRSADTEATVGAVRTLGVRVDEIGTDWLRVHGVGLRGLVEPGQPIDCANAGTLMRLLSGILVGQRGRFELTGDASLSARPMERVAEPLRRMGARIATTDGHAPLAIHGGPLASITYTLPVASAQVKSAILLAGLFAQGGSTTVVEPVPTRDHTESMLQMSGADVVCGVEAVTVSPASRLELGELEVPGDFSSAAPFVVAATLVEESEVHMPRVNLNPRRSGLLAILERMGANVTVANPRTVCGEPAADLVVRYSRLVGTDVGADEVPAAIDELPLFALAASCASGDSTLSGAAELRLKESDRIDAVVDGLRAAGADIAPTPDGFCVRGRPTRLAGGRIESRGDHRIAMLAAVAGLASEDGVEIGDPDAVAVSFPGFFELVGPDGTLRMG